MWDINNSRKTTSRVVRKVPPDIDGDFASDAVGLVLRCGGDLQH